MVHVGKKATKYPRGGNGVRQFNGDYYYGLGLKPQPTKSAAQKLAENERKKTNFWTGKKTKARVVKNRGGWDVFTT